MTNGDRQLPDLTGVELKLARARTHLSSLAAALDGHLLRADVPIAARQSFSRTNAQRSVTALPPDLGPIVGDFLANMRSALDHLAWQIALNDGLVPDRSTQFPIRRTGPAQIKASGVTVRSAAMPLVRALQPYTADDPTTNQLWLLDELRNIDTHRTLHLVVSRQQVAVSAARETRPSYRDLRLNDGDTFSVAASTDDQVLRIRNDFYIEDHRRAIGGTPVLVLLAGILDHVAQAVVEPVRAVLEH